MASLNSSKHENINAVIFYFKNKKRYLKKYYKTTSNPKVRLSTLKNYRPVFLNDINSQIINKLLYW